MNGITYFRLNSPYDGDVTKNCALTGNEVDNNFFTLEGRDIKSVELEDGKIVVNLMNGNRLTTDSITEGYTKDLSIDFDEANGVLTITRNGVTQTITGFLTTNNVNNAIAVDGTIKGNGLFGNPVGLSPMVKTGQYRPVKKIVDMTNGEELPKCEDLAVGDRFLTIEYVNEFGYLYNYRGLKKIACRLNEKGLEWRVPTKEDWDDLLDSVEPCEQFRTHTDARSNKFLGKLAGKFLKSKEYWKKGCHSCDPCCQGDEQTCIDYSDNHCNEPCGEQCACGKNITCHPDYCGEYGHCHYKHKKDHRGLDKYGFRVVPAGYANEAKEKYAARGVDTDAAITKLKTVPVSATATLAPETPISACVNLSRMTRRAVLTSSAIMGSFFTFVYSVKYSATCSLLRWRAGMTMWTGVLPSRAMMNSPRSVSWTRTPSSPSTWFM